MNRIRQIILLSLIFLGASLSSSDRSAQAGTPLSEGFKLLVAFSEPVKLMPGTPVYLEGSQIGTVSEISRDAKAMNLVLTIDEGAWSNIRQGTVALLSSPLALSDQESARIVDLIPPHEGKLSFVTPGQELDGFTSFENYWRNQ